MRTAPFSVAISVYQEGEQVRSTVRSILESDPAPREIVLADDGSTDGCCDGPWPEQVRVLRPPHAGIATARNNAVAACRQPYIVIIDAHCSVDRGWLVPLFDVLLREPAALVCGTVIDEDNPRYAGCGATVINDRLEYQWDACSVERPVQIAPGGFLAFMRDVFLKFGGFGPFKEFGYEDVDLSLTWHGAGRPVLGVPASRVTHRFRKDAPYVHSSEHYVRNLLLTVSRNLEAEHVRAAVLASSHLPGFAEAIADTLSGTVGGQGDVPRSVERMS